MSKILTLLIFLCTYIYGYNVNYVQIDKLVRVYDGDTIFVDIYNFHPLLGNNIGVRLRGIDTPELRNKKQKKRALELKYFLTDKLMSCKYIYLKNMSRGKYFRIVADVYCDDENINEYMLKQPDVYKYNGGKKRKR
jgi:endonuclease YncB( thermonuclease family)